MFNNSRYNSFFVPEEPETTRDEDLLALRNVQILTVVQILMACVSITALLRDISMKTLASAPATASIESLWHDLFRLSLFALVILPLFIVALARSHNLPMYWIIITTLITITAFFLPVFMPL